MWVFWQCEKRTSEMESTNGSHDTAEDGGKKGCSSYQCSGLCYLIFATGVKKKAIQKILV